LSTITQLVDAVHFSAAMTAGAGHGGASVPLTVHLLDAQTADALQLRPQGAMLVRPDGREAGRWPGYDAWLRSGRPERLAGLAIDALTYRRAGVCWGMGRPADTFGFNA
jgi:hypothetical protein